jgi:hypothetical protein
VRVGRGTQVLNRRGRGWGPGPRETTQLCEATSTLTHARTHRVLLCLLVHVVAVCVQGLLEHIVVHAQLVVARQVHDVQAEQGARQPDNVHVRVCVVGGGGGGRRGYVWWRGRMRVRAHEPRLCQRMQSTMVEAG